MSRNIHPEVQHWGPASSLFLDPDAVEGFFDRLVAFFEAKEADPRFLGIDAGIDTRDRDAESGEITVWNGRAFLAGLIGLDDAAAAALAQSDEERHLLQNLRSLAPKWEPLLGSGGELVLVVDW